MKIYVCVHGGIATAVYASKDRNGEAEAVVLDVDKERPDADAILAEWDRIAADGGFDHVPMAFLAPLNDD